MKRFIRHSLLLFLSFCPILSNSQEIQILWDSLYYGFSSEALHELILLPDGRLAGAGDIQKPDKSTDGLFFLINPETGQIERKIIGGLNDQSFKGVAEADDGSFYLVGYTDEVKGMGRQGLIVRLDEYGQEIGERLKIGIKGTDYFEKITWMDNGAGIAVGMSDSTNEGCLWVVSVDGDSYRVKDNAGSGFVHDLKGMQKSMDGRLWLCGNSQKSTRQNAPWLLEMDENCMVRDGFFIGNETKPEENVNDLFVTTDGKILLAGRIWQAINGESDSWEAEYDATLQSSEYKIFEWEGSDKGQAVYKSPQGKHWMVQKNGTGQSVLVGWEAEGLEENLLKLDENTGFEVVRLLKTYHGTYIVAGVSKDPQSKRKGIRLICFKNGETLASKGFSDLDIENPYFEDANKDGFLSPGERASLHFTIRNVGSAPVKEGRIRVIRESAINGLTVLHESQYLPFLPVDGTIKRYIGLKGENNLGAGISSFKIIVEAEGKPVKNILFEVESIQSKQAPGGKKATMYFQRPQLSGNERKVSVSENVQEIRLTISASRQLKAEDLKILNNGTVQENKKAETTIRSLGMEKGVFVYEFSTLVSLRDSLSVVYVTLDDFKTDSIVFEWRSHYPDLHVLAIGPSYLDLGYTAKDARDFARTLAKQEGLGFYDQVFVDTLITPLRTTKSNIEIAFKGLLNKDTSETRLDRIKPNDYLVVFYSGHGIKKGNDFYLVPSDYNPDGGGGGTDGLLDYKEMLEKYLNKIRCKKVMFIDACHSGGAKTDPANMTMARALMEANESAPGLMSFSSCSENELSYEDKEWGNGAFTKALIEAMNGEGFPMPDVANGEEVLPISAGQLFSFLHQRVKEIVKTKGSGANQTPVFISNELRDSLTIFALPKK